MTPATQIASPKPPRKNYIFVDYENVQDLDLNLLDGKPVEVFLILGPTRKTLPVELTKQIHKFHDRVHLIDCEIPGRNALDMVLGYELGRQAATNGEAYFHVLSKDKDFDPLIKHLRETGVLASRDEVFAKIPVLVEATKLTSDQRIEAAMEWLRKQKARPAKLQKLESALNALFRKQLSATQIQEVIKKLVASKRVAISSKGEVTYKL